jgi:predicted transcriptional regulator
MEKEKMAKKLYAETIERRDKIQVYADILRVTEKTTPTTRLLRLANIQYNTFADCINALCSAGLLEKIPLRYTKKALKNNRRRKYAFKATKMGKEWCKQIDDIYSILGDLE